MATIESLRGVYVKIDVSMATNKNAKVLAIIGPRARVIKR